MSPQFFSEYDIDMRYVLQCNGQILRLITNDLEESERTKLSKYLVTGMLSLRLNECIPQSSKIVSEIFTHSAADKLDILSINEMELCDLCITEPFITKVLLKIIQPTLRTKDLFSRFINKIAGIFENNLESCWKLLIGGSLCAKDLNMSEVKSLLSFTEGKSCLRKHLIIEIGLNQSRDERVQFSLALRDQFMNDIIRLNSPVPNKLVDPYQQLCYCLLLQGLPHIISDADTPSLIGWLILVTHSKGFISIILNVISILIEARLLDSLKTILQLPIMSEFKQLLLVNLWHPNLADEVTMQIFLDLCYSYCPNEIQTNYVEQLCLKIKTRWDTLKRFKARLSSLNNDQETPTRDILALTTIGNTSHLELVSGLPDPTGFDYKVVLDLLDRTGNNNENNLTEAAGGNLSLETEAIEENCDKCILYCAVSIRKLWECLVLFTPLDLRQTILDYLHHHNVMTEVNLLSSENSFYVRFQDSLQNNDLMMCHELYHQAIIPRIEYISNHINQIHPFSLRLELLENIYSMLYATVRDIYSGMITFHSQSTLKGTNWPLPETVRSDDSPSECCDNENVLNLDKARFVCPFFLFKDILFIVRKNLEVLNSIVIERKDSRTKYFDLKMADTIKYPSQDDIDTRIIVLSNDIENVQWRIDLLVIHSTEYCSTDIGLFDIPSCGLFENNKIILKPKINLRGRSKSSVILHKGKTRNNKERQKSFAEDRGNSHIELSSKIQQLRINHNSLTNNILNFPTKDKFILFSSPSLTYQERLPSFSTDDGDQSLIKLNESFKTNVVSKENCQFLMDCVPLLTESIDQLTVMILTSGNAEQSQEIFKKYGREKNENSLLEELLTEIRYRNNFDNLTNKLSKISTKEVTLNLEESKEIESQPLGKFKWSNLSAVNEKLSSTKENEIVEVFNELFTLNNNSRPSLKFKKSSEKLTKEYINREIKHFNCGLLFDITITGSKTKWQLCQLLSLIDSHCDNLRINFREYSDKEVDPLKYIKTEGLINVINELLIALNDDIKVDCSTYVQMEMESLIDGNYFTMMREWLCELQKAINSLQFNELQSSEDSSPNNDSRWVCLSNLITFIKETCVGIDRKNLPFKHLDRPIPLYLDSLYSHLEIFVNFLGKYKNPSDKIKNKNQSSVIQLQHEFSVLRLSPLKALGELIFVKSEDPFSRGMLQISEDLGLNISSVVLENCIPTISSCGRTLSQDNEEMFLIDHKDIYNVSKEDFVDFSYNLDPSEVVIACLERIVKILLRNTYTLNQTNSGIENESKQLSNQTNQEPWNTFVQKFSLSSKTSTDSSSSESSYKTKGSGAKHSKMLNLSGNPSSIVLNSGWRILMAFSQDDEWRKLISKEISDLQQVNLELLTSNNEKLAFFINLFNLMMIHMTILLVENGKTTVKYRSIESKIMRSNFCYKVGQIGVLSIEQIYQYYLDIPDVTFADLNITNPDISLSLPTFVEQLYRTTCSSCQNMTIFGIIDGTVSSQPLKIYRAETVLKDLQNNLSYIIKYKTTYETEKRQIILPQMFKWYAKLICAENSDQKNKFIPEDFKNSLDSNFEEVLIRKILSKCNEKVARKYSLMLKLDTDTIIYNIKDQNNSKLLKIIWQSRSEAIGINFIEKRQDVLNNIPKLIDYATPEKSSLNSFSSCIVQSNFPLPNYQPTVTAIIHLRDRSPLLACLAYLTIGEDFVTMPHFSSEEEIVSSPINKKSLSKSSISLDDVLCEIRSYKYSRIVNEYPAIGNWIMNFWSEWLINRKSGESLNINVSHVNDTLIMYCCSNIPIEIRWAAFSHPLAKDVDKILIDYSVNIMTRDPQDFLNICSALRKLQSQTITHNISLQRFLDIILVKAAKFWANDLIINKNNKRHLPPDNLTVENESLRLQENRLLDCIYAIKDEKLRFSESSRYLDLLHIDNALNLMEFYYASQSTNEDLKKQVILLRVFKSIHDLVITCQIKEMNKSQIPTEFLDWKRLQTVSEIEPDLILKFLNKEKQFDLAKCWCKFYMPYDGEQKIEAEYLVSLVLEGNEKLLELIMHITRLHQEKNVEDFLRVVSNVIDHCEAPLAIILICAYTIKNNICGSFNSVDGISMSDWRDKIHRAWVGASMLRAITNEVIQEQYSQLVQHPHLIMEQLIMNAEIDIFRKMMDLYKEQKKVFFALRKSQTGNKLNRVPSIEAGAREEFIVELESERINHTLTEYICKALELSALRVEDEADADDISLSPLTLKSRLSFASMQSDMMTSFESNETVVNKNEYSYQVSDTLSQEIFSMPSVPPPQNKWFKDSDASKCMCCNKEKFSMFNRRHHCRRCGRVICSQCSTHRTLLDGVTVRICDDCHRSINTQLESIDRARHGNVLLDNQRVCSVADLLYSRHNVSKHTESISSYPSVPTFDHSELVPVGNLQMGIGALENGWRLSADPIENETIRQMFSYDDAPSVTIAFCLADCHSNSNACGNLLLDRVEYLADFLKPMKNRMPNPEVDYLLVLDIAKQITYKAKLKFSHLNNDVDFDRAENYLGRLDLLSVLVRSNCCTYLPSLSDGSKFIDKIQSLRDKLIREERLELAGIVSSKAGLSNDPVFVAMGLHCLDESKYDEARKLFASCTKIGRYGSQPVSVLPYPCNEIMKILEGNKLSVECARELLTDIVDSDDLLKLPDLKYREEYEISRKQIEEAIYYLDIYNAPLQCLQFLCRQHMWSKATDYIFKKSVSKEFFIDGLIAPAINSGHFAAVKSQIFMKEGGLNSWKYYYDSLCKFLDKKGCYDDLLEFQEKANDHFQATKTLTNHFYLRGSQSYLKLKEKIGYLESAKEHLVKYIDHKEKDNSSEVPKLTKNLVLIKQQIRATSFLTDPITLNHHQAKLGYLIQSNTPPTLFGSSESIIDFCLTILFCRPNLSDGLQFLCPLMSQCHIYVEKILPKAAVWLLQHPQAMLSFVGLESEIVGVTSVLELCTSISTYYRLDSRKNDEVLLAIIPVIPLSLLTKSNLVNKFIGLFKSESKKIDAYIVVKDFRRAFSCAARVNYANDVQKILNLAEESKDVTGIIDLCKQWLSQNKTSSSQLKHFDLS